MIGSQLQSPIRYIYLLTSPSGKQYVGQTGKDPVKRFKDHVWNSNDPKNRHCRVLYKAMRKYGGNNFKRETLLMCHKDMIDYYETLFIAKLGTLVPNGYNLDSGGCLNKTHSEETKQLQSQSAYKRDQSVYRKYEHTKILPKHVKPSQNGHGYVIMNHPNCDCMSFNDKLQTPEENLQDAVQMLKRLDEGYIVGSPRRVLPRGVYALRLGYMVKYLEIDDSIQKRMFVDRNMRDKQRKEAAIAFAQDYAERVL